jgi:hypothetical protein
LYYPKRKIVFPFPLLGMTVGMSHEKAQARHIKYNYPREIA